ncbi:glycosyltransferase [Novosphingobium sp. UBA1939]|uniref:glycosyltransferase n=1 Tax=Novosphingobium sp. UBA1939 TaxID=1946982 RepID=UPI0025E36416|nr:glycosyltransferase [Novosphingobium sp. UBA1939]
MHVAIAIVAFRNADEIAGCLAGLATSTHCDFEVVICENGGADAYRALVDALPASLPGGQPVTVIQAPGNLGYAGGVNVCIRARPDADAWWVVNPDTVPDSGALAALVARLARGDCAAAGGVLHDPRGRIQAYGGRWRALMARAESIGSGASLTDRPDAAAIEARMNYLLGASMLIGRRFVDAVGLMREDYFLYAEEIEWCLRGVAAGLKLGFAPDARVCHDQGSTTGSNDAHRTRPRMPIYLDERNKLNVVRDTTPAKLPVAALASFVLAFLRYGRRGAWRQWGYAMAGWSAGLRNQRGFPPWMR